MATYWLKIEYFSYPLLFGASAPYVPFGFLCEVNHEQTSVMGLLCSESCMILTSTILTDPPVWRTDRQTDGWMGDSI